ncbi:rRNA pseudouridine synthase [bacterium]|nr:rRNA pseudouridine synthase [bacterium]
MRTTLPTPRTRSPRSTSVSDQPDESAGRVVTMRLQKFLARAGVASRRGAEDLMTAGRVAVNGEMVTELGARIHPVDDTVTVDGKKVEAAAGPIYLILHKPAGYVTTMDDPQGRPTVRELVPPEPGIFPVGRLDMNTTGLLLFTTDGELSHRLLHPKYHVAKTYRVDVDGVPSREALEQLRNGIELDDGPTRPAVVVPIAAWSDRSTVEITISEGRKRQVKRMFSAIGHPVVALHRESFGPLVLDDLPPGKTRLLTDSEVEALTLAAKEE